MDGGGGGGDVTCQFQSVRPCRMSLSFYSPPPLLGCISLTSKSNLRETHVAVWILGAHTKYTYVGPNIREV